MRSELERVLLTAIAVVSAAPAQNVTVPASMQGVEGGGGTNIPFGSSLACRYQCIYDAGELPWVGPRVITGISLRADNNTPGTTMPAKGFLEVSLLMSTTYRSAATASDTFAENYGTDATWVVQNMLMQLPAQPAVLVGPRPANIPFPFAVPWAYGLTPASTTLPPPSNLLIEIWIHSQPSGAYRMDNLGSCTAPTSTFGNVGPACAVPVTAPAVPTPVALTTDVSMQAGSGFAWHVEHAPPSVPFLVALSLSNTGNLLGIPGLPLPVPLFDPANPSTLPPLLAALQWPAPDCWLNIDPATTLGGLSDAAGLGSVSGTLPPGSQYVGTTIHAQAIVLAPTANPLRLITSLGRSSTVCGPLDVARIHQFYSATTSPPPPPPATGTVQYGVGMIFEVQ
ncbi:MAG TPA: hypothetical protein VFZ65_17890 [Planctomycetota bacterium]|nr:hypothetical protein [Planctomycetota bacterium]